jgi:hypothetical protein
MDSPCPKEKDNNFLWKTALYPFAFPSANRVLFLGHKTSVNFGIEIA